MPFSLTIYFKRIYPLAILLSLWVVVLLSAVLIRKTVEPLKKLKEGTKRIAEKDFATKVEVSSGDEFEEVSRSFNSMARQLGRQFNALTTISEIQRSILSSLDTREIVDTVISRIHECFGYDLVGVLLFYGGDVKTGRVKLVGLGEIVCVFRLFFRAVMYQGDFHGRQAVQITFIYQVKTDSQDDNGMHGQCKKYSKAESVA